MSELTKLEILALGDLSTICRLCLETGETRPLEESPLLDHFRKVSQLPLQFGPNLPQNICEPCWNRLNQLQELSVFLELCKQSQQILHDFYNGTCTLEAPSEELNEPKAKQSLLYSILSENADQNRLHAQPIEEVKAEQPEVILDESSLSSEPYNSPIVDDEHSIDYVDVPETRQVDSDEEPSGNATVEPAEPSEVVVLEESPPASPNPSPMKLRKRNRRNSENLEATLEQSDLSSSDQEEHSIDYVDIPDSRQVDSDEESSRDATVEPASAEPAEVISLDDESPPESPQPKSKRRKRKRSGTFVCKFCKNDYEDWIEHKIESPTCNRSHLKPKPQMCDLCGQMVKNLKSHKQSQVCKLTCDDCTFVALNRRQLLKHLHKVHGRTKKKKTYWKREYRMCERCGSLSQNLSLHMRTSCSNMSCIKCDFVASKPIELRKHYSEEHGKKQVVCPTCQDFVPDLEVHRRENKDCQFKCDKCDYSTIIRFRLKQHMIGHSGERQFECDQCELKFKRAINLQRHLQLHEGRKEYKCRICPKEFLTKFELTSHTNIHYGLKPFKCHYCDLTFAVANTRNAHIYKKHKDEHVLRPRSKPMVVRRIAPSAPKPTTYKCQLCPKTFTKYTRFYLHKKTHTELPLACTNCDYKSYNSSLLALHERTHRSGKSSFKCGKCPGTFTQEIYLRCHMNIHKNRIFRTRSKALI